MTTRLSARAVSLTGLAASPRIAEISQKMRLDLLFDAILYASPALVRTDSRVLRRASPRLEISGSHFISFP